MPNRLADETSPYLLQHKDNPVDWHPWGPEALERARAEDRPILLSVGYSACHWCHVMAHESFEDEATARVMNALYVNVKVDREERPDVDSVYMTAVQQMTGQGGWPMTVFLLPDGTPFYGGTYYPPEPRHGMPAFRQVLTAVEEAYRRRRDAVQQSADELHAVLKQGSLARPPAGKVDAALLDRARQALAARYDARNGGFGGAPKFPQPMLLEFLLRQWKRTGDEQSLRMVEQTLRRMAVGGIYDHLGGGFARYSVDARWLVPHFEKMLYDNALLSRAYLHAWQATGHEAYRRVVDETLAYVLREMTSPEGGFYSAQDADSEGEEGRFYVWTVDEVDALLGAEEGALFRGYYGVTEEGNFEGKSILNVARPLAQAAMEAGVTEERLHDVVQRGRDVLYSERSKRVWPGRDDKVLTAWNAMMLHTFAEAGRAAGRLEWITAAGRCAEFLLSELRREGRLLRTWKDGRAKIGAFLEDHALLADALLALYDATWEPRWLDESRALADAMLERFWDEAEGVFYDTATDAEPLVVRPRDLFDNATPSGNSVAAGVLLRLARVVGEPRFAQVGRRVLESLADAMGRVPMGFGHLLCAADFEVAAPREVAFVGRPGDPETDALTRVLARAYLPNVVAVLGRPEEGAPPRVPLLEGRTLVDGRAAAYVCERYACRMPVTEPADLARELGVDAV
ncbi:MAG: hypothetical protein JWM27_3452 [Gemmatimonadetes bacterium]|nr:hypothetical protein [Gemmatimonadota bacterium]